MMLFIKPTVKLTKLPLINVWLQAEYDKIKTRGELIEFVFDKLQEVENTTNPVRREAIKAIAFLLYSYLTNLSYESKIQL